MSDIVHADEETSELPPYVTVDQLAEMLQIGRSKAYELTREYLHMGEGHGIPCIRIGHQIRVPRDRLMRLCEPDRTIAST